MSHNTAIITQSYNKIWKHTSLVSSTKVMLTEYNYRLFDLGFQAYNGEH